MLNEFLFSDDDLARSNWRELIATAEHKTVNYYSRIFSEAAIHSKESGDTSLQNVYLILHAVCDLMLKPEDKHQPFAPVWQGADGSRSVDISDFTESTITKLKDIFNCFDDPELQARIGDIIWTVKHRDNFLYAEASVRAYIKAGDVLLLTDDFIYGVHRYTRAIHLAASLGKQNSLFIEVVARIEALIDEHAQTHSRFVGWLLELLYEYEQGNAEKYALISESYAEYYQQRGEWHFSRTKWNAAARWHKRNKNIESAQTCQLKEAECYVFEADEVLGNSQNSSFSVAAHHLQCAIEALRRIPGTDSRCKELQTKMLELQEKSLDDLGRISHDIDLTQLVEQAILSVQGLDFKHAIFKLCLIGQPPNVQKLREMVINMASEAPLQFLISMSVIDNRGRTVGRRNSLFTGTAEEIENATLAEMHRWARYEQDMLAIAIHACRVQLLQEHTGELIGFLDLVANNPFIPNGREIIFAQGYLAGFQGDFLKSLHLLIPQVENSLRYLLNNHGVITSSLNSNGIQEDFDLNVLLAMPELKQIMGDDLVFDLECTLTSRFGANFRNLMAHGLLDQQAFYSYTAIYIWWQLLRICCIPLIHVWQQEETSDDTPRPD